MSKRTLFLIFALFIIIFVLLIMALYKPSNPNPTQVAIAPMESVVQTTLLFGDISATSSSAADLSYSIPINITTGKDKVTTVQLELQYDPRLLINVSVKPSSFFKNPQILLNQIDTKTGRISYAFGVGLTEQGVTGKGTVAIITFGTNSGTPTQTGILFLPKTFVTAQGINPSVLKSTNNALFTIGIISSPSAH